MLSVRKSLASHEETLRSAVDRFTEDSEENGSSAGKSRTLATVGILVQTHSGLEKMRKRGQKYKIFCVGMLIFPEDITPDLIDETIESVKLYGSLRATPEVERALTDKMLQVTL